MPPQTGPQPSTRSPVTNAAIGAATIPTAANAVKASESLVHPLLVLLASSVSARLRASGLSSRAEQTGVRL